MQSSEDFAGQDVAGVNDAGCPFIGQTVEVAVSGLDALLASMGFGSVEAMMAAAETL